jgi:hypothetical protein
VNRVREALDSADNPHAHRGFRRLPSRRLFSEKPASVSGYDESLAVGMVTAARDFLSGNLESEKPNPGPTFYVEEKTNESLCHDSCE